MIFNIVKPEVVTTPDTTFSRYMPDWFLRAVNSKKTANEASMDYYESVKDMEDASWEYWTKENGKFIKKKDSGSLSGSTITIKPDGCSSAKRQGSKWHIKSGYGYKIETEFTPGLKVQSGLCAYPEFLNRMSTVDSEDTYGNNTYYYVNATNSGYKNVYNSKKYANAGGLYGTYDTLEYDNVNNTLKFINNDSTKTSTHFIPIWYPNGEYQVTFYVSDCWTPGGMLSRTIKSNVLTIDGNMYDDYLQVVHNR